MILLALAFSPIVASATTSIGISGAPSGASLEYTATLTSLTCPKGGYPQETTTYTSFNYVVDGIAYPMSGEAIWQTTYVCQGRTVNGYTDPATLAVPSAASPGQTCTIAFNPDNGSPNAAMTCSTSYQGIVYPK
jgi:hypothetical protein